VQDGNELFLLSEEELLGLKKIRNSTYLKAGLAGVLGVALLFIPYHVFGEILFPVSRIWIPIYAAYLELRDLVFSYPKYTTKLWELQVFCLVRSTEYKV